MLNPIIETIKRNPMLLMVFTLVSCQKKEYKVTLKFSDGTVYEESELEKMW